MVSRYSDMAFLQIAFVNLQNVAQMPEMKLRGQRFDILGGATQDGSLDPLLVADLFRFALFHAIRKALTPVEIVVSAHHI